MGRVHKKSTPKGAFFSARADVPNLHHTHAAALARTLGQVWQASPTAGLYAITADADFEAHFGKKAAKRRKIYNGMIPCQIYMYFDRPVKPVRK